MKIDDLIKEAYKARDNVSLNAYKNIKAELQQVLTAKNAPDYSDDLFDYTVAKYGRKLDKMISEVGKDTNLGKEYSSELEVVKKLLPEPVDDLEIITTLSNWCVENNFCSEVEEFILMPEGTKSSGRRIELPKKEMGNAIKYLKSKFPTADGKKISIIVKSHLV